MWVDKSQKQGNNKSKNSNKAIRENQVSKSKMKVVESVAKRPLMNLEKHKQTSL